jgi:hypothetical protein
MLNISIEQLCVMHYVDLPRDIKKIIASYCKPRFNSLWNYPIPYRHKLLKCIKVYGTHCKMFKYKGNNIKERIQAIHKYRLIKHKYISGMMFQDLR